MLFTYNECVTVFCKPLLEKVANICRFTGASWLCYYKALQMGEASKVVPIDKLSVVITLVLAFVFLHEQFTVKSILGCILIGVGTLLMVV